jgi:hypothetical protein
MISIFPFSDPNPHTPASILKGFVFGDQQGRSNLLVRRNVALNPNADADTIAMLSEDNDDTVIYNLAQNPSTPDAVLSRLCAKHPNPYVHALVASPSKRVGTPPRSACIPR